MHILMINTLYPPFVVGGAERSVCLLAEALARAGDRVSLISLHPDSQETVEALNGVQIYRMPLDNRYWPFDPGKRQGPAARLAWHVKDAWNSQAAERVGRVLDQTQPDVVHTNNLSGFSVAIWREVKKRNIRLVHTLRDYYLLCSRGTLFRNGSTCVRRCADCMALTANRGAASDLVDAVVSISGYVLNCHIQRGYFSKAASSVIYNIAGVPSFPVAPPTNDLQHTLTFGYIGRLEDEKGIRVLLEAIGYLSGANWRLKIAGAGRERYVDELKREFIDPRIEWLGFTNASAFYPSIDVTIIPSLWPEPLSRIVIETFAAGKSAICAQSGGIPEIATLGKVVATYPETDARALAGMMDRAMLDTRLWCNGGFRDPNARNLFSEGSITASYRAVYEANVASAALPPSGGEGVGVLINA
jgi:glycosyltransferase involved in cell wall biosynthesis